MSLGHSKNLRRPHKYVKSNRAKYLPDGADNEMKIHSELMKLSASVHAEHLRKYTISQDAYEHPIEKAVSAFDSLMRDEFHWEATRVFSFICGLVIKVEFKDKDYQSIVQMYDRLASETNYIDESQSDILDAESNAEPLLCSLEAKLACLDLILSRPSLALPHLVKLQQDIDPETIYKEVEHVLRSLFEILPDPSLRGEHWEYLQLVRIHLNIRREPKGMISRFMASPWFQPLATLTDISPLGLITSVPSMILSSLFPGNLVESERRAALKQLEQIPPPRFKDPEQRFDYLGRIFGRRFVRHDAGNNDDAVLR